MLRKVSNLSSWSRVHSEPGNHGIVREFENGLF